MKSIWIVLLILLVIMSSKVVLANMEDYVVPETRDAFPTVTEVLKGDTKSISSEKPSIVLDSSLVPGARIYYRVMGVKFNMALMPAASFPIGVHDSGEATVEGDFWIAEREVTYELWYEVRTWALQNGFTFAHAGCEGSHGSPGLPPSAATRRAPVTKVNWFDAIVWCNALSEALGYDAVYMYEGAVVRDALKVKSDQVKQEDRNGFRLPTSNEWELAARYKDGSSWQPGNCASGATADYRDASATGEVAWYIANSGGETQEVGQKPLGGNGLGLFDMSGNVSEWCFTHSGPNLIARGGSWYSTSWQLRVGYVFSLSPYSTVGFCGFRLARTAF